jgi:2',3'-cyclic-nucleotide 2'-phosphodiesterase (5'-nucleotidase family)
MESTAGNLLTDVCRHVTGASMAFYNSGGIRQDIMPGNITIGLVFEMIPFESNIVTVDLTGKNIKDLMERSAILQGEIDQSGEPSKGSLQISGIKVTVDRKKPVGKRVISMELEDKTPIETDKFYNVATINFLAEGGDGYIYFKEGKNLKNTFINPRDALIEWIKYKSVRREPVNRNIEGRIVIK